MTAPILTGEQMHSFTARMIGAAVAQNWRNKKSLEVQARAAEMAVDFLVALGINPVGNGALVAEMIGTNGHGGGIESREFWSWVEWSETIKVRRAEGTK